MLNLIQSRHLVEMLTEMQTGLDNMSRMALELCRAMEIDTPLLLQSLNEEEEFDTM